MLVRSSWMSLRFYTCLLLLRFSEVHILLFLKIGYFKENRTDFGNVGHNALPIFPQQQNKTIWGYSHSSVPFEVVSVISFKGNCKKNQR